MEAFDNERHETALAERYRRLARFEAFDKLVDLALDGTISMDEAKAQWEAEEADDGTTPTQ